MNIGEKLLKMYWIVRIVRAFRPVSYGIQYKNCIFVRHLKALIARVKVNWSMLSRLVRSVTLPKPKSDV